MKDMCRIISNEQLDKLYEIQRYFLNKQIGDNDLMIMGADEEMEHYLGLCDELLDELDPSSDFNTDSTNYPLED